MQVTETLNEGLKRGYAITVTAAELDAKVNEKLVDAQPEVEMKGFRKGKVPMALLKKQFGQRLLGEAMQESVDGAMAAHFEATGDRPAMQPDVKMPNDDWIRVCSTFWARSMAKRLTAVPPKTSHWCLARASSFPASKSSWSA